MNRNALVGVFFIVSIYALAAEPRMGASFKEGDGIRLSEETRQSIGLEIAEVQEQALTSGVSFSAQVYRESDEATLSHGGERQGYAYASGYVDVAMDPLLQAGKRVVASANGKTMTGTVLRLDRMLEAAAGKLEALIQIPDESGQWHVGDFLIVQALATEDSASVVAVLPKSAILNTAYGDFAYVVNGENFFRTPVTVTEASGEFVEVVDGLYAGDVVAKRPVETLYLIELRATKGGGHSH
jgi:hypothetical protein